MNKKSLRYFIFFGVLLGLFYAGMIYFTDFEKVKLPVINTVQPFSFTRHDGNQVSQVEIKNRVYVAEYFFTTCKGICPKMNKNMKEIYLQYKSNPQFLIISHTVDPENDSIPVLRRYADSLGAKTDNWWFVTGSKESLYKTARESYLLDDPKNSSVNIKEQFLHTQFFTLVDRQGRVRGIYDGIKKDEVKQLLTDINELLAE
jgi:protein SCO1/2